MKTQFKVNGYMNQPQETVTGHIILDVFGVYKSGKYWSLVHIPSGGNVVHDERMKPLQRFARVLADNLAIDPYWRKKDVKAEVLARFGEELANEKFKQLSYLLSQFKRGEICTK